MTLLENYVHQNKIEDSGEIPALDEHNMMLSLKGESEKLEAAGVS